jgi:hypothetical protein
MVRELRLLGYHVDPPTFNMAIRHDGRIFEPVEKAPFWQSQNEGKHISISRKMFIRAS